MTAAPGPFEQSCSEEAATIDAVATAAALSPEQRSQALLIHNALDRASAYADRRGRLNVINPADDSWGPPRWHQADAVTGGPEPQPAMVRLPVGTLLAHIPLGGCLDPLPPRRERSSRARCPRCGGWIGVKSAVPGSEGLIYCGTCCGGHRPTTTAEP